MKLLISLLGILSLFCFVITEGKAQPIAISASPGEYSTVSILTAIKITFSAAMLTNSFNDTTSFIVTGQTSGRTRGTFTFTSGNTIAKFKPWALFNYGEMVVVDLSSNLKDT